MGMLLAEPKLICPGKRYWVCGYQHASYLGEIFRRRMSASLLSVSSERLNPSSNNENFRHQDDRRCACLAQAEQNSRRTRPWLRKQNH